MTRNLTERRGRASLLSFLAAQQDTIFLEIPQETKSTACKYQ